MPAVSEISESHRISNIKYIYFDYRNCERLTGRVRRGRNILAKSEIHRKIHWEVHALCTHKLSIAVSIRPFHEQADVPTRGSTHQATLGTKMQARHMQHPLLLRV